MSAAPACTGSPAGRPSASAGVGRSDPACWSLATTGASSAGSMPAEAATSVAHASAGRSHSSVAEASEGFGRHLPGQHEPQPVLGLQRPLGARQHVGLGVGEPGQQRPGHARDQRVAERRLSRGRQRPPALQRTGGAAVGPQQRGSQGAAAGVADHDAVHVPGEAERRDRLGRLRQRPAHRDARRVEPRGGVGFNPARMRCAHGARLRDHGQDVAGLAEDERLGRRGAEVQSEDGHDEVVLSRPGRGRRRPPGADR